MYPRIAWPAKHEDANRHNESPHDRRWPSELELAAALNAWFWAQLVDKITADTVSHRAKSWSGHPDHEDAQKGKADLVEAEAIDVTSDKKEGSK